MAGRRTAASALLLFALIAARPCSAQGEVDIQVPPEHWSYSILLKFSELGLTPGRPPFEFRGGRVFTRLELARITADIAEQAATSEVFEDPENRADLERLVLEFQVELQQLGRPVVTPLPAPRVEPPSVEPPPVEPPPSTLRRIAAETETSVSNSLRVGFREGETNTVSDLISLHSQSGSWTAFISMDADKSDRDSADMRFGGDWAAEVTRRYLDYNKRVGPVRRLRSVRWGDVTSASYGQGLTAGAQSMTGLTGQIGLGPLVRVRAFWGRDNGLERTGFETTLVRESGWEAGISWVEGETEDGRRSFAGLHSILTAGPLRLRTEYAEGRDRGHGFFVGSRLTLTRALEVNFEAHSYRNLENPFNSPPLYMGLSGGDAENERRQLMAAMYRFKGGHSLILSRDTAWQRSTGEILRDHVQQFRLALGPGSSLTLMREREYKPGAPTVIHTLRFGKRWGGLDFSSDLKRESKDSGDVRTVSARVRTRIDAIRSTLTLDYTHRKTPNGVRRTPQAMVNTRLGVRSNLSLRFSFPGDKEPYRIDLLMLTRY